MILDDIAREKRRELAAWSSGRAPSRPSAPQGPDRAFAQAIRRGGALLPRVIAEVKKASPSKGVIRVDFDPVKIARAYESAGAAAISVLTDEKFFQGSLQDLMDCRAATRLPVLRKDFIIDERQIDESGAAGADAILLIAALLNAITLRDFREKAESFGMAALVEVHDERELESAIESGTAIIGINNRDLRTFEVDFQTTFRLVPLMPPGRTIVSESGIRTGDDLARLADAGVDAALIGETLLRAPDPGERLGELLSSRKHERTKARKL